MRPKSPPAFTLVPMALSDLAELYALTSDPRVARYMRFDAHTSPDEARALLEEYTTQGAQGFRIALEDGGSGGFCALKPDEKLPGARSVSLFLSPGSWNLGLGSQVTRELKTLAARQGIARLTAYVVGENTGSRRVLEKCGFTVREVLRFDDLDSGLYIYECAL